MRINQIKAKNLSKETPSLAKGNNILLHFNGYKNGR